jgi:hypothetical protein
MALQRLPGVGIVSSTLLALSCASVLGIEDAACDPEFDASCNTTITASNLPAPGGPGGNGGAPAVGAAGAPGSAGSGGDAATLAGAGGSPGVAGNSGASNAGSGGSAGAEPMEAPLCDRYCETVATACTGTNEQFASLDACLAVCERLEAGSPGDVAGNTVECRLARAQLAQRTGEAANYCSSAGPGGAGACGEDCEGFCTLMAETCPAAMGTYEACLPACAMVPDLSGPPDNVAYNTSVQDGNSLQCRLFHVTAATLDPIAHCVHAAGLAPCATPTEPDEEETDP